LYSIRKTWIQFDLIERTYLALSEVMLGAVEFSATLCFYSYDA
jgi:hypothetical protein